MTNHVYLCSCCHFIANRKHNNEPVFCIHNIHPRHLFQVELPIEKASAQRRETYLQSNSPTSNDLLSSMSVNSSEPNTATPSKVGAAFNDTRTDFTLISPSKVTVASTLSRPVQVQTNNFIKVKSPDIGFNKLNDARSKLAKVASSHSNALQHVALS